MNEQMIRDLTATVIIGMGLLVMVLNIMVWRECRTNYRWVYLVCATAGACSAVVFVVALLRLYNGTDVILAAVGRPLYILLLLALSFVSILAHRMHRYSGGC